MTGVLAILLFLLASYLTKKLKGKRAGLIALLVGVSASALLYRSPMAMEIVTWANATWMGSLTETLTGWVGEMVPAYGVWSVLCIIGFVVTVVDLRYDHTYNPWAIVALVVTPIAANGSAGGVITTTIDWIHNGIGAIVQWVVMGAVV